MKTLLLVLSLGLATRSANTQVVRPALEDDPVFHQVLNKRLSYPAFTMPYFPLIGRV